VLHLRLENLSEFTPLSNFVLDSAPKPLRVRAAAGQTWKQPVAFADNANHLSAFIPLSEGESFHDFHAQWCEVHEWLQSI
jgi:hypothetical protein